MSNVHTDDSKTSEVEIMTVRNDFDNTQEDQHFWSVGVSDS